MAGQETEHRITVRHMSDAEFHNRIHARLYHMPYEEYEEMRKRHESLMRERREAAERRAKLEEIYKARANKLLKSHLSLIQRLFLRYFGRFYVKSNLGNNFVIEVDTSFNVKQIDKDHKVVGQYCLVFGGEDTPPLPDLLLAQKLLIERDEAEFKRRAYLSIRYREL